ncbi:MAG: hypothetical protein KF691_03470 [Phycisphaeraceae bacterium]|nr:hypothetical protein [Phycisphaeraceae bacterium]
MRRAAIRTSALGLIAIVFTASLTSLMWRTGSATATITEPATVQVKDVRRMLAVAGVEPLALAAAGASATDAQLIVSQARAYLTEHLQVLNTSIESASTAAKRAARRTPEETQTVAELRAAAASAKSDRDSAIAAFRAAALSGVNQTIVTKLDNIRANRSQGLPLKYLVKNRTSDEWAALRNALAAEKTANKRGVELQGACVTILAEANSDSAVAAAGSACSANNTAIVKAAWNTAIASTGTTHTP